MKHYELRNKISQYNRQLFYELNDMDAQLNKLKKINDYIYSSTERKEIINKIDKILNNSLKLSQDIDDVIIQHYIETRRKINTYRKWRLNNEQ